MHDIICNDNPPLCPVLSALRVPLWPQPVHPGKPSLPVPVTAALGPPRPLLTVTPRSRVPPPRGGAPLGCAGKGRGGPVGLHTVPLASGRPLPRGRKAWLPPPRSPCGGNQAEEAVAGARSAPTAADVGSSWLPRDPRVAVPACVSMPGAAQGRCSSRENTHFAACPPHASHRPAQCPHTSVPLAGLPTAPRPRPDPGRRPSVTRTCVLTVPLPWEARSAGAGPPALAPSESGARPVTELDKAMNLIIYE